MSDDAAVAFSIGLVIIGVVVLVAWSLVLRHRRREIQHREWMAALEKGVPLPDLRAFETGMAGPRIYLLRGLVWLFCGLTLTLVLVGVWLTSNAAPSLDAQIRQARELGYSQEQIREMANDTWRGQLVNQQRPGFPFGLSLVGLVPAGVGIAYLLFYRAERRQAAQEK